jgi:hypothetical protein
LSPFHRLYWGAAVVFVAAAVLGSAACGGDHSGGPKGAPREVVGSAPQRTRDARTARVFVDGTDASAQGVVDFADGRSQLDLSDGSTVVLTADTIYRRAKGETNFSVVTADALPAALRPADPIKAVALVDGVATVRSDGGGEVRGASALQYTIDVNPGSYQLEVAVDAEGRLRRVQVPVPLRPGPPTTRVDGEPVAVTIDFTDFGVPATITVPTT